MEYFNYFGSLITNDARHTFEITCRFVTATAAFKERRLLFTSK
jgi:hypothetical protein